MQTVRWIAITLVLTLSPAAAVAQTGVSDDRVSLPEGPGSLEGVGENIAVNGNMGSMSYGIDIPVPSGFEGATPALRLDYSSASGAGILGLGWSMAAPAIERMTSRGLPDYDSDDLFAAGGGAQLTRVDDGEPAIYRARNEGGFVLYKWYRRDQPGNDYWTAESPDGGVSWFGADAGGQVDAASRLEDEGRTFRYGMVESRDLWGHPMRWTWQSYGGTQLPTRVEWLIHDGQAKHHATFHYEARPDFISDCKPRFCEVTEHRLSEVQIHTGQVRLGRWVMRYEDTGDLTRLSTVRRFGLNGGQHPAVFAFTYSRSLGGVCDGQECERPYMVDMGSVDTNLQSGDATLVDLNGDSLPDVVDTTGTGAHRIHLSRFEGRGQHTFQAVESSAVGMGANHGLRAGRVQILDADGDGYADLLNTGTGRVLENKGTGDWTREYSLFDDVGTLPDFEIEVDVEDGDLEAVRFIDIDNDKRIDVVRSQGAGPDNTTSVYINQGSGGFAVLEGVERFPVGFESDRLQLADVNGDGLNDLIRLQDRQMSYRLNLGLGQWTSDIVVENLPFAGQELERVDLEDLNNDGLSDLVLVRSDEIVYVLNMNGTAFGNPVTVNSEGIDGELPVRTAGTSVLFADMNGSGSVDVLWIDEQGNTKYLELFAAQPNLMTKVENSVGAVTEVSYITSVEAAARARADDRPWSSQLQFATTLVVETSTYDELTDLRKSVRYDYQSPYYDGVEKAYRGFADVMIEEAPDPFSPQRTTTTHYNLGQDDAYMAGIAEWSELTSEGVPQQRTETQYDDCRVAGPMHGDGEPYPVRWICARWQEVIGQEGAPEAAWATARVEYEYDGYGNTTLTSSLGVTAIGGGPCGACDRADGEFGAACGDACTGDESYTEVEFIDPDDTGGLWLLDRPAWRKEYADPESDFFSEVRHYYDGAAFVGLPMGELTRGALTRVERRLDEDTWIPVRRVRVGEHGNDVEAIGVFGSLDEPRNGRREYVYDETGQNLRRTIIHLSDENDEPYTLEQAVHYDDIWGFAATTTNWIVHRAGAPQSLAIEETNVYDAFGRTAARIGPGETEDAPGQTWEYRFDEPGNPLVWTQQRGPDLPPLITVRCFDGFGQAYQERFQVEEGQWIVSGFDVYSPKRELRRKYGQFISTSGACDTQAPDDVPYIDQVYDALARSVGRVWHSAAGEELARERTVHGPTYTLIYDENDLDPDSPHFETPRRHDVDGQGRVVAITRVVDEGEQTVHRFTFDGLGNLRRAIDPEDNEIVHSYDRAGRRFHVLDPDRGETRSEFAPNGLPVAITDGAGNVTRYEYDAQGRGTARWIEGDDASRVEWLYDFPRECPADVCTLGAAQVVETRFQAGGQEGSFWLGRDDEGRTVVETQNVFGQTFETRTEFDGVGARRARTFPDGTRVEYEYDAGSRLTRIPGVMDSVSYDTLGHVRDVRLANGTTQSHRYDERGRLKEKRTTGSAGTLVGWTYEHDGVGNVTRVVDELPDAGPSRTADFTYDPLNRLTRAHLDPDAGDHEEVVTYAYDHLDNIAGKWSTDETSVAHVGDYTYASARPHAVTQAGARTFAYDGNGAMVAHGDRTIARDRQGRITAVTDDGETVLERIWGPGEDLRTRGPDSDTWHVAENLQIRDGIAEIDVMLADLHLATIRTPGLATRVLSDESEDGAINVADAWLASQNGPADDLLRGATALLLVGDGDRTFSHVDQTGAPAVVTDEQGEVVHRATWYPYGAPRTGTTPDGRGFAGYKINDLGWADTSARSYDPELGRWLSADPYFRAIEGPDAPIHDAFSVYGYAGGNPTTSRDETGGFVDQLLGGLAFRIAGGVVGGIAQVYRGQKDDTRSTMLLSGTTTQGWNAYRVGQVAGQFTGGFIGGFTSPFLSAVRTLGAGLSGDALASDQARQSAAQRPTPQTQITTQRLSRVAFSFGIGVVGALFLGTGGGAAVVLGVGAAYLTLKSIHIGIKHVNGYRRAFAATYDGLGKLFGRASAVQLNNKRQKIRRQIVGASAADPQTHVNHRNAIRELDAVQDQFIGAAKGGGIRFKPSVALGRRRGRAEFKLKGFGVKF